jgi:hypothetical protein
MERHFRSLGLALALASWFSVNQILCQDGLPYHTTRLSFGGKDRPEEPATEGV